jgi:hypothetical protein
VFIPENRLGVILGGAGDPTCEVLAERAERALEPLRDKAKTYVTARLKRIEQLVNQSEALVFADSPKIQAAALEVCEVAAAAQMVMVGEAARALYTMVSALAHGVWHQDALALHIQTLALIAAHNPPTAEAEALLTKLSLVRQRVGVPD